MITATGTIDEVTVDLDGTIIKLTYEEAVELSVELNDALERSAKAKNTDWQMAEGEACQVAEGGGAGDEGIIITLYPDDPQAVVRLGHGRLVMVHIEAIKPPRFFFTTWDEIKAKRKAESDSE